MWPQMVRFNKIKLFVLDLVLFWIFILSIIDLNRNYLSKILKFISNRIKFAVLQFLYKNGFFYFYNSYAQTLDRRWEINCIFYSQAGGWSLCKIDFWKTVLLNGLHIFLFFILNLTFLRIIKILIMDFKN